MKETAGNCLNFPRPVALLLAAAWLTYGAALVLPASPFLRGFECLFGSYLSLEMVIRSPGPASFYLASLSLPNTFTLLSPLVLRDFARRGRFLTLLAWGSATGAALAATLPVLLLTTGFDIPPTESQPSKLFQPRAGTWVWVASQVLLASALMTASLGRRRATPPRPPSLP